jgi:hypothetical protein
MEDKKKDINLTKQTTLPQWAVIALIVLAIAGVAAGGYMGYKWVHDTIYLQGAQAGYNQALVDLLSMVQTRGYASIKLNTQTVYLVPAQLNATATG